MLKVKDLHAPKECTGTDDSYFACELCQLVAVGTFVPDLGLAASCWDVRYCRVAACAGNCVIRQRLNCDDVRAQLRANDEDEGEVRPLEFYNS